MLEEAMGAATPASSQQAAGGVKFSANKFNSFLTQHDARLRAILTRKEYVEVKRISKALERVADRAGMQGSQTGRFWATIKAMQGVFSFNPGAMGQAAGTIFGPRKIAKAMMTDAGRKALLTLTKTSRPTKAAVASAAYLTGIWAREEGVIPSEIDLQSDQ